MNYGGLENFIMNIYRNIDRNKIQFDFLVNKNEKGKFHDEIHNLGGRIFTIDHFTPLNYFNYVKKLDNFFKIHNYKVVHSHINSNSAIILKVAKNNNIPVRISHSHIDREGGNYKIVKKILRKYVNKYSTIKFACGKEAGAWLFKKDFKIINNAIDSKKFEYNLDDYIKIRKNLNISDDEKAFIHVGRFNSQKNHKFLLEIFKELNKSHNNFKLFLVGDGELREEILKKVKIDNIKNIIYLGLRSDINNLLKGMDYFIMPSLYEGLPVSIIEAQAAGLRVFASNTISKDVNITNNVKFFDITDLRNCVNVIISNLEYTRINTREIIIKNGYDINNLSDYLSKIYLENERKTL